MKEKDIKRFKVYAVILVLLVTAATIIYAYLGGFDKVQVEEIDLTELKLAGIEIDEKVSKEKIKNTFEKLRSETRKGNLKGCQLSILTYQDSEFRKQFMGLVLMDSVKQVPLAYEVRKLAFSHAFKVDLKMHNLVMPLKENVQTRIYKYAKSKGFELDNIFLEIYNHDNSVTIYGFSNET